MWGTSFPGDKLTVDFGNEFGAPFIGDRSNFCFLTKKSVPNNFGLLQQYRPRADPIVPARSLVTLEATHVNCQVGDDVTYE
jgi:hypothetical protein